ncbi:glycosyltransferase family 4 protein [Tritonibacter mobilis]|uniref:glycosyltransferase family 4 protein n=1 Tax=Tritonibacter mobilis TaxID=379347 RepID=UPI000806A300|nr:glycosyltransferase family 4 protein [Tritonibacter mobilis]GLP88140.1 glycosyl transferase [Tritonibacter mobilis]SDX26251.1 Glycosyltransferase involved in cell wall bisynthesis [Tritonibacter mobilis]
MTAPRIAYYAPMKAPTHPTPSGDRAMAQSLMGLLERGGAEVILASELRLHDKLGDRDHQQILQQRAADEVGRLIEELPEVDAWVTYHNYYKAPDLIGPAVAAARDIPYVQIESTRASKRLTGPWSEFAQAAHAAADQAAVIFYLTEQDRETLERDRAGNQQLVHLRPFLPQDALPAPGTGDGPMLAAGMMRRGDKLASYALIAETLRHLESTEHAVDWQLLIAGDGPARAEVESLFARFGTRVRFLGQLDAAAMAEAYRTAQLFLWPGVNEAFGMVYLEAQSHGLPVVAQDRPGLRDVLLPSMPGDYPAPDAGASALAGRVLHLLDSASEREDLGRRAREHIATHHLRPAAADTLWAALGPLIKERRT